MKRATFVLAAWLLLLSLLSANADAAGLCTPPAGYQDLAMNDSPGETGGMGGMGGMGGAGGIGGTGRSGEDKDGGGIGGTGIVGTITGFASICVNGLEVHYDNNVPVSENGKPSNAAGLAIGQIVAVEAGHSARGLEARRIALLHALEGPVTQPLDRNGTLEVMGARVALGNTPLRDTARSLRAGDWVQVSGHPTTDGTVQASRVARIAAGQEASVNGHGDAGGRQVGGVLTDRALGGELTVRGHWNGERLIVRESQPTAGSIWLNRPNRVVLETRIRQREGNQIRTGRGDVDAMLAARPAHREDEAWQAGALIRVTARVEADGKLHPLRIEQAPRERRETRSGSATESERRDTDETRAEREALKAAERQEKAAERAARDTREQVERAAKERADRLERNSRPDRLQRSGRDH